MSTSADPGPSPAGLRLLARAVGQLPLDVRLEDLPGRRGYLSGTGLVLDQRLDAMSREQAVIQAAMLAEGSFDPAILRSLLGRTRTTARYCALEGARAVRARRELVPRSVLRRVSALTGIPLSAGPEESRRLADRPRSPEAPDFFGEIRPLRMLVARGAAGVPTHPPGPDALESAEPPGDKNQDDEGEESRLLKLLSNPLFGQNAISRMFRSMFGQGSGPSPNSESGSSGPSAVRAASTLPGTKRLGTVMGALTQVVAQVSALPTHPGGTRYPEWDQQRGAHRPDWVSVHDADPYNPEGGRDLAPLGLVAGARLRRSLAMATLADQPAGRAADGDLLHTDGVVDLARWRRRPDGVAPLPFLDIRRGRPDVAVLVLLDASDSTQDNLAGQPPVFDSHLALSYRLVATLDELGVPVALYAFQAWGRSMVRFLRASSFTERVGQQTRTRLGHLEPAGYTRIGGAVRHGSAMLERAAPGMKRVLVLVSDGFPYDEGYEGSHAAADTRQSMAEARARGIGCVCVGVTAPSGNELHADALASASALHVADIADIERRLGGLIRQALADTRRRGDHRVDRPKSG
jgi:hypothetical protein